MNHFILATLSISSLFLVTGSVLKAKPATHSGEALKIEQLGAEWRQTYTFSKENYEVMQYSLNVVANTHHLLKQENLVQGDSRVAIEALQADALKKIVNRGKELTPYLLREYTFMKRDGVQDLTKIEKNLREQVQASARARGEAIEAALKSIGIAAIPQLTDFHARAAKRQVNSLAESSRRLIGDIVRREELTSLTNSRVAEDEGRQRDIDFESSSTSAPAETIPEPLYGSRP